VRRLLGVVLVVVVLATAVPRAAAEGAYAPPVEGPIVDRFRPPEDRYGPGNRGVDFRTAPGAAVRASGDGEVVFAGQVGGSRHVVVLHADGLRTSYSYLATVDVRRGDRVRRGEPVGSAGYELHFGVRAGDRYLDPEPLLYGAEPEVHLVPVEDREPGSLAKEVAGLVAGLGRGALGATEAGAAWLRDGTAAAVDSGVDRVAELARATEEYVRVPLDAWATQRRRRLFEASQRGCTPASEEPPEPPGRERIAVLVGGLGSTSGHASIDDLATKALGYEPNRVARFSYAGGQAAGGARSLPGVPRSQYGTEHSNGDLRDSAARFRELLVSIRLAHPGVPVDVFAHSQGGVVVRGALGKAGDATDPRLPVIEHVITLGSPHHGANGATANQLLEASTGGDAAQEALARAGVPTGKAVEQLAERSGYIRGLGRRALPGRRFTSIAASGDLIVPALQSGLAGATNVVVPRTGISAHAGLPGSPEAHREVALALADRGPTCRDPDSDLRLAWAIGVGEDVAGGLAGLAAARLSP
jgi:hypothetical protein